MPKPIKHREMVRRFQQLGWQGPHRRLTIPNLHEGDIDWSLMKRVLKQAGVNPEEWKRLA